MIKIAQPQTLVLVLAKLEFTIITVPLQREPYALVVIRQMHRKTFARRIGDFPLAVAAVNIIRCTVNTAHRKLAQIPLVLRIISLLCLLVLRMMVIFSKR